MTDMTMLTHMRGPLERIHASARPDATTTAARQVHFAATIKRFCMTALTVAAAGVALIAIMALKVAIYLPRVMHH